jgi:hypothetical protein
MGERHRVTPHEGILPINRCTWASAMPTMRWQAAAGYGLICIALLIGYERQHLSSSYRAVPGSNICGDRTRRARMRVVLPSLVSRV